MESAYLNLFMVDIQIVIDLVGNVINVVIGCQRSIKKMTVNELMNILKTIPNQNLEVTIQICDDTYPIIDYGIENGEFVIEPGD